MEHCATLFNIDAVFDNVIIVYEKEVVENAHELLLEAVITRTAPEGTVFISGTSTSMHRFETVAGKAFKKVADKKSHGFRGLVLVKKV